jgi:hypothetical protein
MPAEVKIRLSVEGTPEALAAFRAVQSQAHKSGTAMAASFKPLSGALSGLHGLIASLGAVITVGALVNFGKEAVEQAQRTEILAQEIGTTVGRMSGLSIAAKLADAELKTLTSGTGRLAKSIDDLRKGSPAAVAAFGRIGLAARDFPADDMAINLDTVARAMEKVQGGGTKTAIAMALAGNKGKALLPIMHELAALGGLEGAMAFARRTGLYVDETTVLVFRQLVDSMKVLKMEAAGAALEFMKGFGPEAVAAMADLSAEIETRGVSAFEDLGAAAGRAARWVLTYMQILGLYSRLFANIGLSAARTVAETMKKSVIPLLGPDLAAEAASRGAREIRRLNEDTEKRAGMLWARASDERQIEVRRLRGEQDADDRLYSLGLLSLDRYLKARNDRIQRSTELQIASLAEQAELLSAGKMAVGEQVEFQRLLERMRTLREEGARLEAAPPPEKKKRAGAGAEPATLADQKRLIDQELKVEQERLKNLAAADKSAYDAGLTSLDQYYRARRQLAIDSYKVEHRALEAERAAAAKEADPKKRAAALAEVEAKEREIQLRTMRIIGVELPAEQREELKKLEEQALDFQQKILTAQGRRHDSAMSQIDQEMAKYHALLVKLGTLPPLPLLTPQAAILAGASGYTERAARTAGLPTEAQARSILESKAQLDQLQKDAEAGLAEFEAARGRITTDMTAHLVTEAEGEKALAALERERLPGLKALADTMFLLAYWAKDPEAMAAAVKLRDAIHEAEVQSQTLNKQLRPTIESALGSWLGSTINQVRDLGDAFRSLAVSIAQAVQQLIAMGIAQAILSFVWPVKAAGRGKIERKASGGLHRGPEGEDRILALVSAGEFETPPKRVAEPGALRFLETMRQRGFAAALREAWLERQGPPAPYAGGGLIFRHLPFWSAPHLSSARALALSPEIEDFVRSGRLAQSLDLRLRPMLDLEPIRRLAEGGLLQPGPGRSGILGGSLTLELPEGVRIRDQKVYIESSDGTRTLIKVISKNRRAINQSLR